VYHGNITQCPADAIIIGLYDDMFRPHIDPKQRGVRNWSGDIAAVDEALGGAITKKLCQNNKRVQQGTIQVLSQKDYQPAQWGLPAKHVIVVGLGKYITPPTHPAVILKNLHDAHTTALTEIRNNPTLAEAKTAATVLHGMDNYIGLQDAIIDATNTLRTSTHRTMETTPGSWPLKKLYVATNDANAAQWAAEVLDVTVPKPNEFRALKPAEPQPGWFSRAWHGIQSFFSSIWEGIKRIFGFGTTPAKT
jgi:hypothetical protein